MIRFASVPTTTAGHHAEAWADERGVYLAVARIGGGVQGRNYGAPMAPEHAEKLARALLRAAAETRRAAGAKAAPP